MRRGSLGEALPGPTSEPGGRGDAGAGLLSLGLRTDAVARILERVQAGPVAAEVLAEAILHGPPVGSVEADMLPRDRE